MSGKLKGKVGGVVGKDSFQRINFLYQMATLASKQKNPTLSAYYGTMCRLVGQKSVLRMEPEMKRKICKNCRTVLIPGTSAQLMITGNDHVCEIKCNNCSAKKIFHINANYKMWLDDPQSIVEVITPTTNITRSNRANSSSGSTPSGTNKVQVAAGELVGEPVSPHFITQKK